MLGEAAVIQAVDASGLSSAKADRYLGVIYRLQHGEIPKLSANSRTEFRRLLTEIGITPAPGLVGTEFPPESKRYLDWVSGTEVVLS